MTEPKPAAAAPAPKKPVAKVGGKVTVACKIPNGLWLRVFKMIDEDVPVMGGGTKTVKRAEQLGDPNKINGPATPFGKVPKSTILCAGDDSVWLPQAAFALTPAIDADFFAKWMEQNKDHDAVRNHLIFAHESPDHVEGLAKEHAGILSGLQPMMPDKDLRAPRTGTANITAPATASKAA